MRTHVGLPYNGSAPDLGAFEFGATPWLAGSDVVPPEEWPDEDLILGLPANTKLQRPKGFHLNQNYPNPFNLKTKIGYHLPAKANVQIDIFNTVGEHIRSLVSNEYSAGYHTTVWDGLNTNGLPANSGIYFYRITAISANNMFSDSKKMVLLK